MENANPFISPSQSAYSFFGIHTDGSTTGSEARFRAPFKSRRLKPEEILEARTQKTAFLRSGRGKAFRSRSRWQFLATMSLGVITGAVLIGISAMNQLKDQPKLCMVLDENFEGDSIDTSIWSHDIELGGFGNGEFEITTDSPNNSFVSDGRLYIVPTLTSDVLGEAAVLDGYTLNLTRDGTCTGTTAQQCVTFSNSSATNTSILPPIMSARLSTRVSKSIRYGRIEVKAQMPTGDWLWPAIWMLPRDYVYGPWPRSGEIDIVESRGNIPLSRKDEDVNAIRSSLHWGPEVKYDGWFTTTAVRRLYRKYFNSQDYVFGLEWTPRGLYTWQGSRARKILQRDFNKSLWDTFNFGPLSYTGAALTNPWLGSSSPDAAPFDQDFYLILNVAVGGTNGYFPDSVTKPWANGAQNPMADFWTNKDRWLPTWPSDPKKRGMSVEYVKMWQQC